MVLCTVIIEQVGATIFNQLESRTHAALASLQLELARIKEVSRRHVEGDAIGIFSEKSDKLRVNKPIM